ncbi:MAG: two-component regulator propeller domain-containing protein, partial [Candidatus Cryptobacteroides sp.]
MRHISAAILLVLMTVKASGKDEVFQFTHINTTNSSISYDGVSKIMQDSRGFIWIGTFKGLNMYDGSRFVTFYKEQLGLDSDSIHAIIEDREGNLWIGTDRGVTRFIYKTASFERFDMVSDKGTTPKNKVTFLYCDTGGKIWIFSNYQGCFCYDPHTRSLLNYRDDIQHGPEYDTDAVQISFRRIVSDGLGGFFLSKYHDNLYRADGDLGNLNVVRPKNDPDYFSGDEVEQLFMSGGKLIVASNIHGISIYDPMTGLVEELFPLNGKATLVDAFFQDKRWIWLCTTGGLWRYDLKNRTENVIHIVSDNRDRFSLSGNYVYSAIVDRDGDLWVGTKDGGVNFCGAFQRLIRKQYYASEKSLQGAVVSGFAYDGDDIVWVGTEQQGLLKYRLSDQSVTTVGLHGIPDTVFGPFYDDGDLWFGSLNGLFRLDTRTMRLKNYGILRRNMRVSDPRVYYSFRSSDGTLYFSNTLGLFEYIRETDSFRQINCFNGVYITSMAESGDGRIWVSSFATGLFVWDPKADRLVANYRFGDGSNLPSDKISSVLIDNTSDVWVIGFSDGFARLCSGKFIRYDTSSLPALPSNVFFNALQDNKGDFWLTSDKGLVQFSPVSEQVSLYTNISGLLDNKMTQAMAMLPSGEIFAGSDNGFIHFNPKDFRRQVKASDVIVSGMEIGDSRVNGNIDRMREFRLSPDENSFGFQLSVMGLMSNAASRVRVILEGYDGNWRDITSQKSVYYFNVPPGDYTFRIMTSSDGATWIEKHEPIKISVSQRFIDSIYGICLIVAGVSLIVAIFLIFFIRHQNK